MIGQTGFWGLEFTHSLTTNADVILGLGTRFGDADSSSWYQGVTFDPDKTTFLQIDIDPNEIGRNYAVEIGAIGDLKIGLAQILEEVKKICPEGKSNPELREQIAAAKAAFKASNEAISNDGRFPMTPQRILKDVKEVIPEDAIIFTDVGWNRTAWPRSSTSPFLAPSTTPPVWLPWASALPPSWAASWLPPIRSC